MLKLIREKIKALRTDERAATAIEYGLIAALISIFIFAAVSALGDAVVTLFTFASSDVTSAMD